MSFFRSLDISASGLTAQRMRMDVIAQNIANADTTRTPEGGPYCRHYTVFQQIGTPSFSSYLSDSMDGDAPAGAGVRVSQIGVDTTSDFKVVFDPSNPDANTQGYVVYPNVDLASEMVDMISATRAYEANVTALNAMKDLANKALELGK